MRTKSKERLRTFEINKFEKFSSREILYDNPTSFKEVLNIGLD